MIYKFKGTPNKKIPSKTGNIVFTFDCKGEYMTDNEEIINRAKGHFDYVVIQEDVKEEVIEEEAINEIVEEAEQIDVEQLSYNELRSLATKLGLELGTSPKKGLLKEAITEYLEK